MRPVTARSADDSALQPHTGTDSPVLRRLRIASMGYSPEWTAYLRRRPCTVICAVCLLALCMPVPYLCFAALLLAALLCTDIYRRNEPLQLLLLPCTGASQFLIRKIGTAWRNYFGATLPFALLAAALHPRAAWIALLWPPLAAWALAYIVLAKYARYDPARPSVAASLPAGLGLSGLLIPPLLPLTLWLTIRYALDAERNLNRYLYDYD